MFEKEGRQSMDVTMIQKLKEDLMKAMEDKTTVLFSVFCDTVGLKGVSKITDLMFEEGKIEIFADNIVMVIEECNAIEYDEDDNIYNINNGGTTQIMF